MRTVKVGFAQCVTLTMMLLVTRPSSSTFISSSDSTADPTTPSKPGSSPSSSDSNATAECIPAPPTQVQLNKHYIAELKDAFANVAIYVLKEHPCAVVMKHKGCEGWFPDAFICAYPEEEVEEIDV